jgi:hypothetical protein
MSTPKLNVIETQKGNQRSSNFTLNTTQSLPAADKKDNITGEES